MKHPYRPTPRTMDDGFGHPPSYYDPYEHHTKPLTQRLSFWFACLALVLLSVAMLASNADTSVEQATADSVKDAIKDATLVAANKDHQ